MFEHILTQRASDNIAQTNETNSCIRHKNLQLENLQNPTTNIFQHKAAG
jgi:hypothetical protein